MIAITFGRACALLVVVLMLASGAPALRAQDAGPGAATPTLATAQQAYYNGEYEAAASHALALLTADPENLAAYELRTAAVLFQIKRLIGEPKDKDKALKACGPCSGLIAVFNADIVKGRNIARARVKADAQAMEPLFFLGKIDLNYIWLQLGPLGRKTGWNEYWEARRSLDAVLKREPKHVRARVARAWIDYIVDTRMTRGFRWILGGGNKKRALIVAREAADAEADFFTKAEARFALWEMQIREQKMADAVVTARLLARDFPANRDLAKFLATHAASGGQSTNSTTKGTKITKNSQG
jgi:tetratricopeptide (TPR) repeat protein